MNQDLKSGLMQLVWQLREGNGVVGVKRDSVIALLEGLIRDADEREQVFNEVRTRLIDKLKVSKSALEAWHNFPEGSEHRVFPHCGACVDANNLAEKLTNEALEALKHD